MDTVVSANDKAIVPTDIAVVIREGTYSQIAPRSGIAAQHHLAVGARDIDADYRGNVRVVLINHGKPEFHLSKGDRIAQFLLKRMSSPTIITIESLPETTRRVQGFGLLELNTLGEYSDISSAAAADTSVESLNILAHVQSAVDPKLIAITLLIQHHLILQLQNIYRNTNNRGSCTIGCTPCTTTKYFVRVPHDNQFHQM